MKGFEPIDHRGQHIRKTLRAEIDADIADVLMFIGRFSTNSRGTGYREEVVECFTRGCCFWFAYILKTRFKEAGAEIVIDNTIGHFGTRIRGRVYDITGDVTEGYRGTPYTWEPWDELDDDALRARIVRDCIMF